MPQNTEEVIIRFVIDSENKENSLKAANNIVNYLTKKMEKSKCYSTWTKIEINKTNPLDAIISFVAEKPELVVSCLNTIAVIFFGILQARKDNKKEKVKNNVPITIDTTNANTSIYNYKFLNDTDSTTIINNQTTIINPTIIYQGNSFNTQIEINNYIKKLGLEN
jgi:uncharacterized protein with NAD-binding domain and iron-sulfur cluster